MFNHESFHASRNFLILSYYEYILTVTVFLEPKPVLFSEWIMIYTIALFGEAEKGEFCTAYYCQNLEQLDEFFGNPPINSKGLDYAVQALLFKRRLIFFRVREEGFSTQDYLSGVQLLEQQPLISQLDAICIPGVGDPEILNALHPVCKYYHSILITNEADFYDYLTSSR